MLSSNPSKCLYTTTVAPQLSGTRDKRRNTHRKEDEASGLTLGSTVVVSQSFRSRLTKTAAKRKDVRQDRKGDNDTARRGQVETHALFFFRILSMLRCRSRAFFRLGSFESIILYGIWENRRRIAMIRDVRGGRRHDFGLKTHTHTE